MNTEILFLLTEEGTYAFVKNPYRLVTWYSLMVPFKEMTDRLCVTFMNVKPSHGLNVVRTLSSPRKSLFYMENMQISKLSVEKDVFNVYCPLLVVVLHWLVFLLCKMWITLQSRPVIIISLGKMRKLSNNYHGVVVH